MATNSRLRESWRRWGGPLGSLFFGSFLGSCGSPSASTAGDSEGGSLQRMNEIRTRLRASRYNESEAPTDPSNRVADHPDAVELGQKMFFDASFSGPLIDGDNDGGGGVLGRMGEAGKVSCAGCHVPEDQFVDTRSPHRQISLGAMWTARRTPTLLDVAFASLFNWDGRRDSLWSQAAGVMESHIEFNTGRLFVATQVFENYRAEYEELFGSLAPLEDRSRFVRLAPEATGCQEVIRLDGPEYICRGKPGDQAEYDSMTEEDQRIVTEVFVNVGKSMAAYVSKLRCGKSRFDDWLDGDDDALNEAEVRGAELFSGEARCLDCHSGPLFTDGQFHNVGLAPATVAVAFTDLGDRGAGEALPLLKDDPLNSHGLFSDGERADLPDQVGAEMEGAFRTPGLRCSSDQPSFMHTGQFTELRVVLEFFNEGGHFAGYPGESEIEPLGLSEDQLADLEDFLRALEGAGPGQELLSAPSTSESEPPPF